MSGIIIYGTFHGSTKKCAEKLSELTGFSIIDAKNALNTDLSEYETIVLGSALQKFRVHPDIEKLFNAKKDFFFSKKTYFFQVSTNPKLPKYFKTKLQDIKCTHFGGKIDWQTLNSSERFIIRIISILCKTDLKNFDNINENKIKRFAAEITAKN
jgi:menaquinone-dependent protoporphyrinogen IX oxidase